MPTNKGPVSEARKAQMRAYYYANRDRILEDHQCYFQENKLALKVVKFTGMKVAEARRQLRIAAAKHERTV